MTRFHYGEIDAFDVDQVLFQDARAARALWKFCHMADIEMTAHEIREDLSIEWWERAAQKSR